MSGHLSITVLAWLFGLVTLAAPMIVAYRFRRRPVIWLIASGDRRAAFHRDALAAIDAAIAAARVEGRAAEAERLVSARGPHRHALAGLAAAREFAGRR